ncbi:MAG: ABC transporter permease [Chloroflexota bacterium]
MMRILALAGKDLKQLFQNKQTILFILVMPVIFTILFGFMFGGTSGGIVEDPRLPVMVIDLDQSAYSQTVLDLIEVSTAIRPVLDEEQGENQLRAEVQDGHLPGLVIIPEGFMAQLTSQEIPTITIVENEDAIAVNLIIENEVRTAYNRMVNAALTAVFSQQAYQESTNFASEIEQQAYHQASIELVLLGWETPPVETRVTKANPVETDTAGNPLGENAFSQASPAMMAQFAIAGLIGAAEMLVSERRSRTMSRMLTTRISKTGILLGHYLAIFTMIFLQLIVLVLFGQFFLKLNYFGQPLATLALITVTAMATGAMGLLIGALAKTSDQAVILSLTPMFIFSGLGGAWLPLEFTSETVQAISKFTPVAWTMQGFKDVLIRGAGLAEVSQPLLALLGFTVVFFALAVWRFRFEGE